MDAGNFSSAYASAACRGHQVNPGAPFVNNQVPVSLLNPSAPQDGEIAAKLPTTSNQCGQFLTGNLVSQYLRVQPRSASITRELTEKYSIFGRYLGTKINTVQPYSLSPSNILTDHWRQHERPCDGGNPWRHPLPHQLPEQG